MSDICNRIEALGYRVDRWNGDGDPRWVTGPNNHGEVVYFRVVNQRGMVGFVTSDGHVITRVKSFSSVEQFEEHHKHDKPY